MSALTKDAVTSVVRRARPLASTRGRTLTRLGAEAFRLRLVAEEELDTSVFNREFPAITVEQASALSAEAVKIEDFAWRGAFDFCRFDDDVERAEPLESIAIRGDDAVGVACEVMTRYQRLLPRRNRASATATFDAVLDAHAALYDRSDPLSKADHDHALDTWQWTLRLEPDASVEVQIAALLHDVDRLDAEPHERIEHRARDREGAIASKLGERAFAMLGGLGLSREHARRVRDLVGRHEDPARDAEILLLEGADALSFLSLESCRYADHFGLAQTRRKVAYAIGRFTPEARARSRSFA